MNIQQYIKEYHKRFFKYPSHRGLRRHFCSLQGDYRESDSNEDVDSRLYDIANSAKDECDIAITKRPYFNIKHVSIVISNDDLALLFQLEFPGMFEFNRP